MGSWAILALLAGDIRCRQRLEAAVEVGRRVGGRVTGLFVAAADPLAAADEQLAAELQQGLIARCSEAGLSAEWVQARGDPADLLAAHGRFADLIVVSRSEPAADEGRVLWHLPERLVMDASAPLLVVPPSWSFERGFPHAVIAWKDSREAARAVRDALPLLRLAARVTVLAVQPAGRPDPGGAALAAYLAGHRIAAEQRVNFAPGEQAGPVLLAQARQLGADLMVLGAYGRRRAVEFALGGVTQHVLSHGELPLLIAH